jgi:hypothetical protein
LRVWAKLITGIGLAGVLSGAGYVGYRTWPRPLQVSMPAYPSPILREGKIQTPFPARTLLADVSSFDDGLSAYLWYDYLRGRAQVDPNQVLITVQEQAEKPEYKLSMVLPNDASAVIPFLSGLQARGYIQSYTLLFSNSAELRGRQEQTSVFTAAYHGPAQQKLETLSDKELLPSLARFLIFKSRTDPRTRSLAGPKSLDGEEAADLAADIIAVARFYDLPVDVFLGIGAMENNYMNVPGDLEHTIWKRKAAKDDIVLKRQRRRVLVSNFSVGVWQITRETLRYAHALYRKDQRDYSQLPERLRPPQALELDLTNSHVLTTYAGLLLRDLLDRFHGDVQLAVGAYNGGPRNPNAQYAAGVGMVSQYARNVLERVNALNQASVTQNAAAPPGLEPASPQSVPETRCYFPQDLSADTMEVHQPRGIHEPLICQQ